MNENKIFGMIFRHGESDFSTWVGFDLTKEEQEIIENILAKHETDGYSVRGTLEECIEDIK